MIQKDAELQRMRDRTDDRYLDSLFEREVNECDPEEIAAQAFQAKLPEILDYCDGLQEEPFFDSVMAVKDNFGLTNEQLETVIHQWIMR